MGGSGSGKRKGQPAMVCLDCADVQAKCGPDRLCLLCDYIAIHRKREYARDYMRRCREQRRHREQRP